MDLRTAQTIINNFDPEYKTKGLELIRKYPQLREYAKFIASGFDAMRGVQADRVANMDKNFDGLLLITVLLYQLVVETRGEL